MAKGNTHTYSVSGTHCHACEILIEKEIKSLPGVKSVSASTNTQTVTITGQKIPDVNILNKIFKDSGYVFLSPLSRGDARRAEGFKPDIFTSLLIVSGILFVFFILKQFGLFSLVNVNTTSLLPSFFLFGLLAGFSTCAALVGGIVLSLSRQWQSLYSFSDSTFQRLQPTLIFNFGRLTIFTLLGGLLGYFGSFFHLSLTTGAILTVGVSIVMFILGLQMLNVNWANFINFSLPKKFTSSIADTKKFQGRLMPFVMGGLTFFLPCGFTLTAQSLALASSSVITGGLIMFLFALGTFVPLLLIGYGSASSQKNPRTSAYFSQVAGILVVIFAIYNLYSQSVVLGINPIISKTDHGLRVTDYEIIDGVQIIKMDASSTGYTPNSFKIKAGQKTRWEITDKGTSGCTNGIIAKQLFGNDVINLVPGTTSVKEFIAPSTPGIYRFSCWMGMVSGTIEVVD